MSVGANFFLALISRGNLLSEFCCNGHIFFFFQLNFPQGFPFHKAQSHHRRRHAVLPGETQAPARLGLERKEGAPAAKGQGRPHEAHNM